MSGATQPVAGGLLKGSLFDLVCHSAVCAECQSHPLPCASSGCYVCHPLYSWALGGATSIL